MRIRHYRFLANRCREKLPAAIRQDLECPTPEQDPETEAKDTRYEYPCPKCRTRRLRVIEETPRATL